MLWKSLKSRSAIERESAERISVSHFWADFIFYLSLFAFNSFHWRWNNPKKSDQFCARQKNSSAVIKCRKQKMRIDSNDLLCSLAGKMGDIRDRWSKQDDCVKSRDIRQIEYFHGDLNILNSLIGSMVLWLFPYHADMWRSIGQSICYLRERSK